MNSTVKVRRIVTTDIEVTGLGDKIKTARESDPRSLSEICRALDMSRTYWYKIEGEKVDGVSLPEDTLRRIEAVLGVDFGVSFD
jgi:transcriptional regulator with XRE-family HTH domain